jgi:hypothetical protein
MTLLPLLALLTAQAPSSELGPVVVVVTSMRPGSDALRARVAERVLETCRREGLVIPFELGAVAAPRSCNGTRACVSRLAVVVGPRAVVVGVDVAEVAGQLSISLQAIAADAATPLASVDLLAPVASWEDGTVEGMTRFARKVREGLAPAQRSAAPPIAAAPRALPGLDAPVLATAKPSLTPALSPTASAAFTAPRPRARTAATITAVGGVAAIGLAVGLLVSGLADKSTYEAALFTTPDGATATHLPEAQARTLASSANGKLAGAAVATGVGAALGVVSAYLFTRP